MRRNQEVDTYTTITVRSINNGIIVCLCADSGEYEELFYESTEEFATELPFMLESYGYSIE
jgi:hypothetical protein